MERVPLSLPFILSCSFRKGKFSEIKLEVKLFFSSLS